jgi:adenine-specific DNA-methyltransferase
MRGDATALASGLEGCDLAYLDPPYNQHRYESNYHIWDTLVRWDAPEHYGTACKRIDLRDTDGRSPFNSRRTFPDALRQVIADVRADTVIVSYNDESWVGQHELATWLLEAGHAEVALAQFDSARYVGARIGIHNPDGERVGTVGRTRNKEWMFLAGAPHAVSRMAVAAEAHGATIAGLSGLNRHS